MSDHPVRTYLRRGPVDSPDSNPVQIRYSIGSYQCVESSVQASVPCFRALSRASLAAVLTVRRDAKRIGRKPSSLEIGAKVIKNLMAPPDDPARELGLVPLPNLRLVAGADNEDGLERTLLVVSFSFFFFSADHSIPKSWQRTPMTI